MTLSGDVGTNTKKSFDVRYFEHLTSVQIPTSYRVTSKLTSETMSDVT